MSCPQTVSPQWRRVAQLLKQLGLFDEPKRDRPSRPPKSLRSRGTDYRNFLGNESPPGVHHGVAFVRLPVSGPLPHPLRSRQLREAMFLRRTCSHCHYDSPAVNAKVSASPNQIRSRPTNFTVSRRPANLTFSVSMVNTPYGCYSYNIGQPFIFHFREQS